MARSIDNRIVSMTFDNSEFERNARTTMGTIQKLKDATDFKDASSSFRDLEKAAGSLTFKTVTEGLARVRAEFSYWEVAAIRAVQNVTDKVVDAGLKIAKSLTIDQPISGWNKYEEKVASVQTLMNSTGLSVKEINTYLDELMWYSDQTSYGFTDMTKALASMTATGGKIENLVPMIMGIANATAYAGKGASEFSRVIYNLNQSYGQGYLSLMDWKSVQNAGAASKQLMETLIKTAEAEGKVAKGLLNIGNFTDNLSKKYITSDVMEKAFNKFASMTVDAYNLVQDGVYDTAEEAISALSKMEDKYSEIAIKSLIAAQSAKSFKEVIDATKDAVSSEWMAIYENIFGNYEEAKQLWSRMALDFWDIFASPLENVRDLLSDWKDLWQVPEDSVDYPLTQIEYLYRAFAGLMGNTLGKYFGYISQQLNNLDISAEDIFNTFKNLGKTLTNINHNLGYGRNDGIRYAFIGIGTALNTAIGFAKTFMSDFIKPLVRMISPLISIIGRIINNLGLAVHYVGELGQTTGMERFSTFLGKALEFIEPIVSFMSEILEYIAGVSEKIKDIAKTKFLERTKDNADGAIQSFGLLDIIILAVKTAVEILSKGLEGMQPLLDKVMSIFENLGGWFSGLWIKVKDLAGKVKDFFAGIFENLDFSKIAKSLRAGVFTIFIASLTGLVNKIKQIDFSKVNGLFDIFNPKKLNEGVKNFVGGLTPLKSFAEGIQQMFGGGSGNKSSIMSTIKDMALAVVEIAAAFYVLSTLNIGKAAQALGLMLGMLGEVVAMIAILNSMQMGKGSMLKGGMFNNNFKNTMNAFKAIAQSVLILSVALKVLDTMNPNQMLLDLVILGGLLAELWIFVAALGSLDIKSATKGLSSLIGLSIAVVILTGALKILSTMNVDELGNSLGSVTVLLGELLIFVIAASKFSGSAAKILALGPTLIAISVALGILTLVIKMITKIPAENFDSALGKVIGMLLSIGLFAVAMDKFGGGGLKFAAVGLGMLEFAVSLGLIVAALGFLTLCDPERLMGAWTTVSLLLLSILVFSAGIGSMTGGGLGFIAVAAGLTIFAVALAGFTVVLMGLTLIPFDTLIGSVLGLSIALIAIGGTAVLLSSMTGAMLTAAGGLVIFGAACVAVGLGLSVLGLGLGVVWDLIVTIISDIYNGIKQLVIDIGSIISGIGNFFSWLFGGDTQQQISDGSAQLTEASAQGIKDNQEPLKEAVEETAVMTTDTYAETIEENQEVPINAVGEMMDKVVEETDREDETEESGINFLQGILNGVNNGELRLMIIDSVGSLGNDMVSTLNAATGVNSPSKFTMETGKYMLEGLAIGLSDTRKPELAAESAGAKIIDVLSDSIKAASEQVEDDLHPVISPVLDLSNIQDGIGAMNGMFGQNGEVVSFARNAVVSGGGSSRVGSIGSINLQNAFTVNNGNNVNREVLNQWADTLTNRINENLGRLL